MVGNESRVGPAALGHRGHHRRRRRARCPARAGAAAAAVSRCAAPRRRDRVPGGTGTAGRGPRRSPTRAPRRAAPRPPAGRAGGPSTGRPAARPGTAARRSRSRCPGSGRKSMPGGDVSPSMRWGAYQMSRGRSPARFIASAALPACNSAAVGHEVGAADRGDGPPAVPEADQHPVVTAGHRPAVFGVGRCRWARIAPIRLEWPRAECNSGSLSKVPARRDAHAGHQCLAGSRGRFHQQQIAGGLRQPVQQRVVGQVLALRHQDQRVGAGRLFDVGDAVGRPRRRRRRRAAASPAHGRRRVRSTPGSIRAPGRGAVR